MAKKKGKIRSNDEHPTHKQEISDQQFEELMSESFLPVKDVSIGEEVEATVIGFDNEHVFLDLGSRLDGIVKRGEYTIGNDLTVEEGDIIDVFVNGKKGGVWLCSGRLGAGDTSGQETRQTAALMALEEAFNRNSPVEGQVVTVTKGGFEVEIMGVKAFCPISQIDTAYCDNSEVHLEKIYPFIIIRFEDGGDNIVVSRREHMQAIAEKESEKLWLELDESKVYEGTITAVRDFGAFIDIGGIEGLLHISEISYKRLEKAGDVLEAGQVLDVSIKSIDRQMRKVSFSRKSLLEDPWTQAIKKLAVGSEAQGKVVRMKTFGVFVELFPGVDGMVHISRLGTGRRHQHPKEVLAVGDMVTVRVMEINPETRRISLTMEKQEVDYTKDLAKINKEQDDTSKGTPSHMADLFDKALSKD